MAIKLLKPNIQKLSGRSVPLPPKKVNPHYHDRRHVLWADAVRAKAGYKCQQCGRTNVRLFADHVHEIKDGGAPFDVANGQCLCGSCHTFKTAAHKRRRMGYS